MPERQPIYYSSNLGPETEDSLTVMDGNQHGIIQFPADARFEVLYKMLIRVPHWCKFMQNFLILRNAGRNSGPKNHLRK
jgi:hypothetical protein